MTAGKETLDEQPLKGGTSAARLISEALTPAAIPHAVVPGDKS